MRNTRHHDMAAAPDAGLPRLRDGFRNRGRDITRLEVFVDAAFAFAVTLLVISIDTIPGSIDGLIDALKGIPAFGLSLAMIALFWSAHVRWSRRYGLDDAATTVLSMVFVFLILVYVYPLKMMFASFFEWVTNGWVPANFVITGVGDIRRMFIIYGVAFITLSMCLLGLYLNAWRRRGMLALDDHERRATAGEIAVLAWFGTVGALSVLAAVLLPDATPRWAAGVPGMVYFLLSLTFIPDRLGRRWAGRMRDAGPA